MAVKMTITRIHAREILDSRGNPTIETEVTVETETIRKEVDCPGGSTFRSQHRRI